MNASFVAFCSLIAASSIYAQRESVGVGAPAGLGSGMTPDEQQRQMEAEQEYKIFLSGNQAFRVVDGKVYNIINSQLWKSVSGQVEYLTQDKVLILYAADGLTTGFALKNYPSDASTDKEVRTVAIRTGIYNWNGQPLPLWDCGTPYVPPPPTPEQIKAMQESQRIASLRDKQNALIAQSNAVAWLKPQATNGDASAQLSLAEHYLTGLGCETNRQLAIFWLQKAAAQGSIEASNKLVLVNSKN